jgi:hypothetical protein
MATLEPSFLRQLIDRSFRSHSSHLQLARQIAESRQLLIPFQLALKDGAANLPFGSLDFRRPAR